MSEPLVHIFNHYAMATQFQVRIANQERTYAAQAAQTAFALAESLELQLSRFKAGSDISQATHLAPGEQLRISEATFACLSITQQMEFATRSAFSATPAALKSQRTRPLWALLPKESSVRCDSGRLEFDLGAIGKGFALDRMGEVLREWDCPAFLLVAGGSSILAGDGPVETGSWSCGLGDDNSPQRYQLTNCSLSGSGLAVKGNHILDPRTGQAGTMRNRAWALTTSAAESDALSTACMILTEPEINEVLTGNDDWLVFLQEGREWRSLGKRPLPASM